MTIEYRESPNEWQRDSDETEAIATALWLMLGVAVIALIVIAVIQMAPYVEYARILGEL